MMERKSKEILVSERNFDSVFSYSAGITRSKFLTEIRDNKKLVGTKCTKCNFVWVPARSTCIKCFSTISDFVDVSDTGIVTTFSVINSSQPFYPAESPFVYAIIQLEGADTGLVHLIGGVDPDDVKIGMKVRAVFKNERIGSIMDIKYFKPVGGN